MSRSRITNRLEAIVPDRDTALAIRPVTPPRVIANTPPAPMRLDRQSLADAVDLLIARDRGLERIVRAHGTPPLWARPGGFKTLVRIILEQQVSLASAASLYRRLSTQIPGGFEPAAVLGTGEMGLRALGVTRQKSAFLCSLATHLQEGRLRLDRLAKVSDEEVTRQLTQVTGIGPWTANVYLLIVLRRPDVWPHGDLALHKALARLRGLPTLPSSDQATKMAQRWAPFRAVAARILWHGYLSEAP